MDINTIADILEPRSAPRDWQAGDAWLGGGTWLFSEPQPDLRRLVDVAGFGWDALTVRADGLEIAASCTLAELNRFSPPRSWTAGPLLRQCCSALLGSFKVWNVATVGGNVCLSLPAGPMTSLTSALDAVATLWAADGSVREVAVADFVTGANQNVLYPGELMRSIHLPLSSLLGRTAFRQVSLSPLGRSGAVVIGRIDADGRAVFTITAATTRPVQLRFAALPTITALDEALDAAAPAYYDDIHGLPQWREAMTREFLHELRAELEAA
jgi:CO/xanthine dehydrogenase FAD-binding subunit